jgi:MoaA/NifB/PqqE/SkfB family radical SAM enzyme
MSHVAVVFPPLQVSRDFIDYPFFADLGALQASALLSAAGHRVELVDALALGGASARPASDDQLVLGAPPEVVSSRVPDSELLIVAYSPFHRPPTRDPLLGALLAELRQRQPARPVVLADLYQGGQHYVGAEPTSVMDAHPEVDVWLRYEAEAVLAELVSELCQSRERDRRVIDGPEVDDLDALPLPDWSRVDVEAYFELHRSLVQTLGRPSWAFPIDERSLPLVSARGCPFRCSHCSSNPGAARGAPKRQRRHGAAALARRLDQLVSLGARRVHVLDELANVNEQHFDDLLRLVVERDLLLEIPNGLRADYVAPEHLATLAGRITTLSVSAESGSQRVVSEVVGKELDLAAITDVASRAHAAKIPLLVHFIVGFPGETRAEINRTLDYATELAERYDAWPSVQFATPLPGTRLARDAAGIALPVIHDWGPRFQREPTVTTAAISVRELSELKVAFDERLARAREPLTLVLDVTHVCNNRCSFCMSGTGEQVHADPSVLREHLERHRAEGASALRIDGGEPTLYPDLFSLLRDARALGYGPITLTTNARRAAYPEYARHLCSSGLDAIVVSLHGATAETHTALVHDPDAFEQTVQGLKNLLAHAAPSTRVGVSCTLTRGNLAELDALARDVESWGARELELRMAAPFGALTHTVAPSLQDAADAVRAVLERGPRLRITVTGMPYCVLPGHEAFITPDEALAGKRRIHAQIGSIRAWDHWREEREHRAECETCTSRPRCAGFVRAPSRDPRWVSLRTNV